MGYKGEYMLIKIPKIVRSVVVLVLLTAFFAAPEAQTRDFYLNNVSVVRLCGIGAAVCIAGAALIYGFGARFWHQKKALSGTNLSETEKRELMDTVGAEKPESINKKLFIMVINGDLERVKVLVETHKANVSMASGTYNRTPLHVAAINSNFKIAQYLVSKGADKNKQDKSGKKPIDYAPKTEEWENLLKEPSMAC